LRTFSLVGLIPDAVTELTSLFQEGSRTEIVARLSDEAGLPWVRSFEQRWAVDEEAARRDALFDLIWHRRARELDPIVTARNFSGFDVLLETAGGIDPGLRQLLGNIDPNDGHNPRAEEGPTWWRLWHEATGTEPGGWLSLEEINRLWQMWALLTQPGIEQTCVESMGATYTHPGCWALLDDLGGFFAQCVSEGRTALAEVDV
jgi:hypothetical protein